MQPKSIVELGTHFGFSYFTFCQTVKRFNINCKCISVDTWNGWGGEFQNEEYNEEYWNKVFNSVTDLNKEYVNFSTLLRMQFDDALCLVPDTSVDLLHIDGSHTYKSVSHDWETWKPKLSNNGVVLFHDTNVRGSFGVWKVFEEISKEEKYTFEFLHSYGLGVMAKDPSLLSELFNVSEQRTNEIRAFFEK